MTWHVCFSLVEALPFLAQRSVMQPLRVSHLSREDDFPHQHWAQAVKGQAGDIG